MAADRVSVPPDIEAEAQRLWTAYRASHRAKGRRIAHVLKDHAPIDLATSAGRVTAWRVGEGRATLLVHGISDDHTIWDPMMRAMIVEGRPFVTLDLPGHGLSAGDSWSLPGVVAAIRAVAETLGPVDTLVGHSLGGLATASAIAQGMPVRRLAVMAVTCKRRIRLDEMVARMGVSAAAFDRMQALHAAEYGDDDLAMTIPHIGARIGVPFLFVHSRADERVAFEDSEAGHAAVAGSELWVAPDVTHRQTAREPATIAKVLDFLA